MRKKWRQITSKTCDKVVKEVFYNRKKLVFSYNIQQICSLYKIKHRTLSKHLKKRFFFNYTKYRRWKIREYVKENHGKRSVLEICEELLISKSTYYRFLTEKYATGGDRKSQNWRFLERFYFVNDKKTKGEK